MQLMRARATLLCRNALCSPSLPLQDVQLQNANAWGDLASAPEGDTATAMEEDGAPSAGVGGSSAPDAPDALWTEFQSREEEQRKRDLEKRAQEDRAQAAKAEVCTTCGCG